MINYEKGKLYAKDGGAFFTEYPFFYDGITLEEFEKKKRYYVEHFIECQFEKKKEFWDSVIKE